MPKLWSDTIDAHRSAVRDAALSATAALVAEHGLRSVTMSQIAERTGIGRATLYKYFADVDAILVAWHERQIAAHLHELTEIRDGAGTPGERLGAVLEAYALMAHASRSHRDTELGALLHRDEHVARAQHRLRDMVVDLLVADAERDGVRDDVAPVELASYCLHALTAAGGLSSEAAVRRLVTVTLAGLRPDPHPPIEPRRRSDTMCDQHTQDPRTDHAHEHRRCDHAPANTGPERADGDLCHAPQVDGATPATAEDEQEPAQERA